MNKFLVATKELSNPADGRLEYYLLSEPMEAMAADNYGIEVVLLRNGEEDRCQCRNITPVGSRILELLTALIRNAVMPCQLRDVVCDLLA